jgi:ATP-binding cassette, subfamily C, bacterial
MLIIKSIETKNGKQWPEINLSNISTVCVDGPSGSGKSLYFNELINLHFNEDLFKGNSIVYIPQVPSTFNGSIKDNITLYRNFSEKRLELLCGKLNFSHIDLQAKIYDKGLPLSGGELQRLVVIRALLCQPDIIIADETTSAMDLELALSVHKELMSNSSVFLFSSHHDKLKALSDIRI